MRESVAQAFDEFGDGGRLVAGRLIGGGDFETG